MKLYKEMLRKLAVVGLPLLMIMAVVTLIRGVADCFGAYYYAQSTSAITQIPGLRYYVFTGVLFALYGFSFQFTRAGSDVYHSLPVKRTELYTATFLATATWMGATILLCEIEMLLIYLISGCPFVPAYIPLSILYYFAAAMIVYAAAAIGCALSGTVVTALASTGIVLLLPRFVQFLFARGIVERVPIVGWLDFGALLNPTTNAATGILAMHLRQIYNGYLITLPHILYSLLLAAIMLALGLWLFKKRPSEFAQNNGGYRWWTVASAVMLSFAVLLPVTMNHQKLFSTYGVVLMAAALGVFIVYQIIVSTRIKKAIATLPFFLLSVVAVLAVSGLINTAADSMLNQTPAASEIESVSFPGYDRKSGETTYTTLLTEKIAFTDGEVKAYVAQSLMDAVDDIKLDTYEYDYEYNRFKVIEPVEIKLVGGGTLRRTIEFQDIDELNALRMQNDAFESAVKEFPPMQSVQYLEVEMAFTDEEEQAILESYVAEATSGGLYNGYYYRSRMEDMLPSGDYAIRDDNQILTGIYLTGYIGSDRYNDSYSLRLNTPETAALLMRTYNSYAQGNPASEISDAIKRFDDGDVDPDDNINLNLSVYNYIDEDGLVMKHSTNFYLNRYAMESDYKYDVTQIEYMRRFNDVLAKAVLTDVPEGVFIQLDWRLRFTGTGDEDLSYTRPTVYLRFENSDDEQEFLALIKEWEDVQRSF